MHTQVLVLERKSNVYKYRIDEIIFVRLLLIRFILHFLKISMKDSYEFIRVFIYRCAKIDGLDVVRGG